MPKRSLSIFLLAAIGCATLPIASQAEPNAELANGTWTGLIDPPSVGPRPMTYTVSGSGESLAISAHLPLNDGSTKDIQFYEIRVEDDALFYKWGEKSKVIITCKLSLQEDGTYFGPCPNNHGGLGYMHMIPPKE